MLVNGKNIEEKEIQPGLTRKILAYGDEMMTCEFHFEEGVELAPHSHFNAQTSYIVSGVLEFDVNGEKVTLSAGDSIFFPPHQPHGVKSLTAACVIDNFSPKRDDFLN